MSRSKSGLTARQQLFFNEMVRGKEFNQILDEHRIRPVTVMRWSTEQPFVNQYMISIKLLALRTGGELHATTLRLAQAQRATANPPASDPTAAPGASTAPPAMSIRPAISEREVIRRRHGEEAAQAFDRLKYLREQREAALAVAADKPPAAPASPEPAAVPADCSDSS
jgi:hypothetical protein